MQEESIIQQLPFTTYQKGDIAGRDFIREKKITRARELYLVNFDDIEERDGFNGREDYGDLEALADGIDATGGIDTPMTLDMLKTGEFKIDKGHRRFRALTILQKRYAAKGDITVFYDKFGKVESFINPVSLSEEQRQISIFTSNNVKPLTPLESGKLCTRLKECFGLNHTEISQRTGIARQTVDNHIRLWALPEQTKQSIREGRLSVNEALSGIRDAAKLEKDPKFTQMTILPGDDRDEQQSSEGKGVGQTVALQKDRALDKETRDAQEEERLFASNSEEQDKINRAMGNLDKIQVMVKKLEAEHPALVGDVANLCDWTVKDLIIVRDELVKLQKN